jgi:hypothetical protein
VSTKTPRIRWLLKTLFWIITFVCAGFTAVASFVLWASVLRWGGENDPGLATRLLVKGILFGALTTVALRWLRVQGRAWTRLVDEVNSETPTDSRGRPLALSIVLVAVCLITIPYLGAYPHIEPDESHHLIVARNLAEYGVYGSGHPDAGFRWFDDYDSVGPPVILPVALSFKLGGVSLFSGRIVVALCFLALCVACYWLLRPLFGTPAAITAMAIGAMAVGSAYLSRTVYGEAPALLFLIGGLLFWRRSILGKQVLVNAALAGLLFGLMILTKYFMVVVAWAFLGAYVYDRLTFRKLQLVHVLIPAVCAVAVLIVWLTVQSAYGADSTHGAAEKLSMYRHNLMFGFDPVLRTAGWILRRPVTLLVSIAAMIAAAPVIFYRRYDPAGAVLYLFAPFIAYWWIFFTTGNIPRYLWYCIVIAAMFTGPLAYMLLRGMKRSTRPVAQYACVALGIVVLGPYVINTWNELMGIYGRNDMADEYALVEYVQTQPVSEPIATTFYPLERTMNLLANRHVVRIPATPDALATHPLVLVDSASQEMLLNGVEPVERFGRYVVVKGTQ